MTDNLDKLKRLLAELFQLDQADLDFGIYRIMNSKRNDIELFLNNDLLSQVRSAFSDYESEDRAKLETELSKTIEKAKELGADPYTLPKVKDLKDKLAATIDLTALENEVYSHLYNFFRRYYNEGDFISLRRYKEGVYAIPYEGEEVKLYWANHDQYYIKTAENFRNYTFKLPSEKRVHFKLVDADTEKDNVKASNGNDRRFVYKGLTAENTENAEEIFFQFEYESLAERKKQDELNREAIQRMMIDLSTLRSPATSAVEELSRLTPTEKNPERTVLEKRLNDYTARNTFDYFIHKNLGEFLQRELDFYIKNEIMHLDDIENESAPRVEQYLAKIKAIRKIAHKIIDFLAQLENFQKKLWLKKKFVVETNYCITLDRVPESLYEKITSCDAQREEWDRLFSINEIEPDLHNPGYSAPLTVDFLKANRYLVLDTKFFDAKFKTKLMASVEDIDENCDGLLIHSENFQGLCLLQERYREQVKCIYIDPPYNTSASEIMYKNGYKNSSWITFVENRILSADGLFAEQGIMCATIDDFEFHRLRMLLENIYSKECLVGVISIKNNPAGRSTAKGFSIAHEYGIFISSQEGTVIGRLSHSEDQIARYKFDDENGQFEWVNFRKHGGANANRYARPKLFYPIFVSPTQVRFPEIEWNAKANSYDVLEKPKGDEKILYPVTPNGDEKTWKWGIDTAKANPEEFTVRNDQNGEIGVYRKARLNEAGTLPLTTWDKKEYSSTEYGTNLLKRIFGESEKFSFPKSVFAVMDSIRVCNVEDTSIILDYFAGSGTTGHAVINLNREDDGNRKYILVEMGEYFDTVLKPRIQKVVYSKDWKDGKPASRDTGVSHMFKYIRLESYEDTLNNLELKRTDPQQSLLQKSDSLREDYMLRYMLDVESRGSASLLNIDRFSDPFNYKLEIATGSAGETKPTAIDLVETFNYLIGLRVKTIDDIAGVRVVTGTNPKGDNVLVLWRKVSETNNDALDKWLKKHQYKTKDLEFDVIYVNGDNNLENLKREDETWKVRLIEEEFKRLMFDVEDV
jgi:adenine-specific DNA-methyltransferase